MDVLNKLEYCVTQAIHLALKRTLNFTPLGMGAGVGQ